ncbi:hypothetical protein SAMN02910289_00232 [Lachnospiraceae bacterium RM5]|nr:hypothetical protein SAMN02910289_00232 [Lachnospiraceae bacterium RM5]
MDNLIFSLNATMPIFLVIAAGYILRQKKFIDEGFLKPANKLVFKVTLPAMLVIEMMDCDIKKMFDLKYVLYCASVTMICILIVWLMAFLYIKDKSLIGEFVQGSYRGSAAILGIALLQNIIGNANIAPLMMLGSVPLYNIFAVIILNATGKGKTDISAWHTIKGIITNPIIVSILGGMLLSLLGIKFPFIIHNTIEKIGSMTTPLALIVIGGEFNKNNAIGRIKEVIIATVIKLIIQPLFFLPIAVNLGFSSEKIVAALVMLGAPTTATCFVMAKNMGHEGTLSTGIIVLTTLLSAFTITGWLYILKILGYI